MNSIKLIAKYHDLGRGVVYLIPELEEKCSRRLPEGRISVSEKKGPGMATVVFSVCTSPEKKAADTARLAEKLKDSLLKRAAALNQKEASLVRSELTVFMNSLTRRKGVMDEILKNGAVNEILNGGAAATIMTEGGAK